MVFTHLKPAIYKLLDVLLSQIISYVFFHKHIFKHIIFVFYLAFCSELFPVLLVRVKCINLFWTRCILFPSWMIWRDMQLVDYAAFLLEKHVGIIFHRNFTCFWCLSSQSWNMFYAVSSRLSVLRNWERWSVFRFRTQLTVLNR